MFCEQLQKAKAKQQQQSYFSITQTPAYLRTLESEQTGKKGERKTDIILREESATSTFKEQYETFVRRKLHRQNKDLKLYTTTEEGKAIREYCVRSCRLDAFPSLITCF